MQPLLHTADTIQTTGQMQMSIFWGLLTTRTVFSSTRLQGLWWVCTEHEAVCVVAGMTVRSIGACVWALSPSWWWSLRRLWTCLVLGVHASENCSVICLLSLFYKHRPRILNVLLASELTMVGFLCVFYWFLLPKKMSASGYSSRVEFEWFV